VSTRRAQSAVFTSASTSSPAQQRQVRGREPPELRLALFKTGLEACKSMAQAISVIALDLFGESRRPAQLSITQGPAIQGEGHRSKTGVGGWRVELTKQMLCQRVRAGSPIERVCVPSEARFPEGIGASNKLAEAYRNAFLALIKP